MTMYPVERVHPRVAGQRERFWDRVHAPTVNQKTPFGGVDRLVWEMISNEKTNTCEMKTLKAKVLYILEKGVTHMGVPTVLRFLVNAWGHLQAPIFDKLFAAVKASVQSECGFALPRRLTFHVLSYEPETQSTLRRFVSKRILEFKIPSALRDWLCKCIVIVTKATPSVGDVLKRGPVLFVPAFVTAALNEKQYTSPFAAWRPFSQKYGVWVVQDTSPQVLRDVSLKVRRRVCESPCACHKWFTMCPTLQNVTQHVILRERRDWVQMFGPVVGALLGSNPRNRLLPSPEMICESVAELEERLQTATVPVFSTHDAGFTKFFSGPGYSDWCAHPGSH